MEFYKILERIMEEQQLNIPAVARKCNLSDGTVRSIFARKQKNVALEVAFKFSKGLGVSLERLNGSEEMVSDPKEAKNSSDTAGATMDRLVVFNELRKKSNMSLDEISSKSGVPKGTLSKISAGITKNPSIETMRVLVHAMGYTLNDLDPKAQKNSLAADGTALTDDPSFNHTESVLIEKYRALDDHGKRIVNLVLDEEYRRIR